TRLSTSDERTPRIAVVASSSSTYARTRPSTATGAVAAATSTPAVGETNGAVIAAARTRGAIARAEEGQRSPPLPHERGGLDGASGRLKCARFLQVGYPLCCPWCGIA